LALTSKISNILLNRRFFWLRGILVFSSFTSVAWPIGMVASLDEPGRTIEHFQPISQETGLSLSFPAIPLLQPPRRGPQPETEINYYTGFVQIRTYYFEHHITNPLALEIRTFNAQRNKGWVVDHWRKNIKLSLTKAQFQKHGAGLQWEIIKVPKPVRAILGEGGVGLQVNGYRKITFSGTSRWQGGVQSTGSYRQSKFPSLDMKQISRFTIKGNIGSKIHVTVDQDSKRESDLSNRMQIRYKGDEDDILQTVELGNTTLNLPNTKYVGYSQRIQGLFGVKATAKLGNLDLTFITSQEKGNTEKTRFTAGGSENVTYIRDYQYLKGTYFDIGRFGPDSSGWGFVAGRDSIIDFKLYQRGVDDMSDPYAKLYIDPKNPDHYSDEYTASRVREVPYEDYFWERHEFWIRLERSLRINELLACWMLVQTPDSLIEVGWLGSDTEGSDVDTLKLKLLRPSSFNSGSATWDYEWKNVYYLGAKQLSYEDFDLDIFKGDPGTESDLSNKNNQDGAPYLRLFGLDVANDAGETDKPDGKVDRADNILDLWRGHLVFPNHRPFAPDPEEDTAFVSQLDAVRLIDRVPEIYTTSTRQTLADSTTYYFRITTYSQRLATYSLKRINILEESETVTLSGQRLIRGVDYQIDYEMGQITFLTDRALDPNADLTIDFEYAPFIMAEKKSLFGARLEYSPGMDFKVGSTFLYKGQKSTDRKPKLGQEKSRSIIGELDFSLTRNPQWMTKLANAMPLVETSAKSSLRISGEVARSMPNPNTEGYVYLDDFEGAKLSNDLGRLRETWTMCSRPDSTYWPYKDKTTRGRLVWYNPYYDFLVTDVYDREAKHLQDQRLKVLALRLTPDSANPEGSWGGIMRSLPTGMHDQSYAQYLEIRLGTYGSAPGKLHIDLGEISEDIDNDGILDTEDRQVEKDGVIIRQINGILDEGEDTGLDMVFSQDEKCDSCLTDDEEWIEDPECDPADPSGDDWYYKDDDPENYDHINGTEGNGSGDLQDVTGRWPDTEDLDRNGFLDHRNNYYSFTIDLEDSPYKVEGSERTASRIADNLEFRTYRIPLWGPSGSATGGPQGDSTLIRFARLWLDGMTKTTTVVFAAIEIAENRWQALPLASEDTTTLNKSFRAETINNEEDTVYYSPPGVTGYYDRQRDVREKEQSLLLKFENFAPGDTGWATKTLNRTEDYTGYRFLRMYVHGDDRINYDLNEISFIFRMGSSNNDFYEYHVDLVKGWDKQNEVIIDFDELTPLKIGVGDTVEGRLEWQKGRYKIRGFPSLTRIKTFSMGVAYKEGSADSLSGEIWLDEMRLDGVRRDQGTAARISLSAKFADLWDVTVNSGYQTYSFLPLTGGQRSGQGANLLNGSTRTTHDASTGIRLGKFLPASWRVSLPVTLRYSKDVSVPKLQTGSDIVLKPEQQRDETSTKISYRVSSSMKMSLPSKHWLAKLTVNGLGFSGSYNKDDTWSPRVDQFRTAYSAKANYKLDFKNLLPISPLIWTRYLFLPKRIWATQLRLLPKSFMADGSISRSRSISLNSEGVETFNFTRRFKGRASLTLEPFSVLSGTYGFSTERDLYDPELLKFSFNPRKFHLGRETKFTQRLSLRYKPPLLSFLSPSTSYSCDYNEDSDPKRYKNNTRKASVSSRITANASLNFKSLLGGGRDRRSARRPTPERDKRPPSGTAPPDSTDEQKPAKKKKGKSGGFRPQAPVVWLLRLVTSPIAPIKASYKHSRSRTTLGLLERPSFKYRIGLSSAHGVKKYFGAASGRDRDGENITDDYGLNSSFNVFGLTKVSTSYNYRKSSVLKTSHTRQASRTFPKLSTSLKKLNKIKPLDRIPVLNWVLDKTSANFNYTHTFNESEKLKERGGDSSSVWFREKESNRDNLGTSIKLVQNFKGGWRITADYGWSLNRTTEEKFGPYSYSDTRKYTSAIGFSTNYSFRAPNGVRLPFLRKLRIRSTLNLSVSVKSESNRSEKRTDKAEGAPYSPIGSNSRLTIKARANYSFSSTMKGGFDLNWVDAKDNQTKRTNHTRQVSIWVEIRF